MAIQPRWLLLVDDEPAVLHALRRVLEGRYTIATASSAEEAARLAGAAVLAAGTQKPPSGGTTAPAAPPQPAAPAAAQQRSDASCAAPLELSGIRVQIRPASGTLRLGVFAGLKDADDENVAHLRKLAAEVVKRGAEVMVADGDVGDNPDEQETLLGVLTETGLPLLVAPGNREVRAELDAAESELRKKGAKVWDLSHARVVDAGDALVVGL